MADNYIRYPASGGATGPSSSTLNSLAYFSDTTGKNLASLTQWGAYTASGALMALSSNPFIYLDPTQSSFLQGSSNGSSVHLTAQAANSTVTIQSSSSVTLSPGTVAQSVVVYQNFATQIGAGLGVGAADVTTTPYTINPKNGSIFGINVAGAATVNLPNNNGSINGLLIIIKDTSGAGATNHITIKPSVTDTIDGVNASVTISTNYGVVRLYNNASTKWFTI